MNTAENNNVEYQKKRSTPRKYLEKNTFNIIQKMWWNLSNYKKKYDFTLFGSISTRRFSTKTIFSPTCNITNVILEWRT